MRARFAELHDGETGEQRRVAGGQHQGVALSEIARHALGRPRPGQAALDQIPRHHRDRRRIGSGGQAERQLARCLHCRSNSRASNA